MPPQQCLKIFLPISRDAPQRPNSKGAFASLSSAKKEVDMYRQRKQVWINRGQGDQLHPEIFGTNVNNQSGEYCPLYTFPTMQAGVSDLESSSAKP
jgi:hypothetical protein